jgi:hypothetical protein
VSSQDGDVVTGAPYYYQSMWHNLVLLAAWGVPGLKLAFIDLVRAEAGGGGKRNLGGTQHYFYSNSVLMFFISTLTPAPQPILSASYNPALAGADVCMPVCCTAAVWVQWLRQRQQQAVRSVCRHDGQGCMYMLKELGLHHSTTSRV